MKVLAQTVLGLVGLIGVAFVLLIIWVTFNDVRLDMPLSRDGDDEEERIIPGFACG